jgi:hypothetical protein
LCFDPDNDNICAESELSGCTDVNATNFDPLATENDESCVFSEEPNLQAYLFPEPQSPSGRGAIGMHMFNAGFSWRGWGISGVPGATNYSSTMNHYAHFSGFVNGLDGDFITPVESLSSFVLQSNSMDGFGCMSGQYTFGTIQLQPSMVNLGIKYFYTIWIPLESVNNSMSNQRINVGTGPCSSDLGSSLIPDSLRLIDVEVTEGAAIPAGTYRVLWVTPNLNLPSTPPLTSSLFFKGSSYSP